MRKSSFVKKIKLVLRPIYFGLGIFAVTGLAFYVFAAAITYPTQPTPVTGVVGMFVGLSNADYSSAVSGYFVANQLCATQYAGSHICTAAEIINTYNHNPAALTALEGADNRAWFNNGPPGYLATPANDCNGWQDYGTTMPLKYGAIWFFQDKQARLQGCKESFPFACCM